MANLIECWICGTKHDYCPTCGNTHGWKYVADTPRCYQIYMTFQSYKEGVISKEEAAKEFAEKCDIKASDDLSWLLPNFEYELRQIIGERKKDTKSAKKSKLFE